MEKLNNGLSPLVNEIVNILTTQGVTDHSFWLEHEYIVTAINSNSEQFERIYVNRYWREYLGSLNTTTVIQRFYLDENSATRIYLKSFSDFIAPIIVASINVNK